MRKDNRIKIVEVKTIKIMNDVRYTAKAKFPESPKRKSIVIFKINEELFAIPLYCPHEHANLSEGVFVEDYILECPLHHNRYDLRSGVIKAFKVEMDDDGEMFLYNDNKKTEVPVLFGEDQLKSPEYQETPDTRRPKERDEFSEQVEFEKRTFQERIFTLETEISSLHQAQGLMLEQMVQRFSDMKSMMEELNRQKKEFD